MRVTIELRQRHNMAHTTHTPTDALAAVTFFPRDESGELVIPPCAYTLDGFRQWALSKDFPQRGRFTFVGGGLIVDMSPESLERHNEIKTEVSRVLANLVRAESLGRLYTAGALASHPGAGVSSEPDALFLSRDTLKAGRVQFTPEKGHPESSKEIVGGPDWVLEIVSPSSVKKDKQLLREAYYQAGVGEYWLIDALGDQIEFQSLVPGDGEYQPVPESDGWIESPTFNRAFRLTRDTDQYGLRQYTLHARETSRAS